MASSSFGDGNHRELVAAVVEDAHPLVAVLVFEVATDAGVRRVLALARAGGRQDVVAGLVRDGRTHVLDACGGVLPHPLPADRENFVLVDGRTVALLVDVLQRDRRVVGLVRRRREVALRFGDLCHHGVLVFGIGATPAGAEAVDARELAGRPVRELVAAEYRLSVRVEPQHPVGSREQRLRIVVGLPDKGCLGVADERPDFGLDLEVLLVELVFDTLFQEVLGRCCCVCSIASLNVVVAVAHGFRVDYDVGNRIILSVFC